MTVTRLKREMPMSEFFDWVEFYNLTEGDADDGNLLKDDGGQALLKGFDL